MAAGLDDDERARPSDVLRFAAELLFQPCAIRVGRDSSDYSLYIIRDTIGWYLDGWRTFALFVTREDPPSLVLLCRRPVRVALFAFRAIER
jgi:hypothetical protein